MWKITNISTGEEEKYYTQDELNSVCIQCNRELENYRLKKENEEFLKIANTGGALLVAEKAKLERHKQALEEIRNLANEECDKECGFHWCKGAFDETTCVIYKIKNKINEVLND